MKEATYQWIFGKSELPKPEEDIMISVDVCGAEFIRACGRGTEMMMDEAVLV